MYGRLINSICADIYMGNDHFDCEKKQEENIPSVHAIFSDCTYSSGDNESSNNILKASITVEMALIMPIVLMVVFFIISVGFYEHDKAVFVEQSFLTARNKCMYGEERDMGNNIKKTCMAAKGVDVRTEESILSAGAVSEGSMRMLLFRRALRLSDRESYVKCYAPDTIRMIYAAKNIKESIMDRK